MGNYLYRVTFINSAEFDYYSALVEGNVALCGLNNKGKTAFARGVMFGEHGMVPALALGNNENISFYFHKGVKQGMIVYDYRSVTSEGMEIPYCAILLAENFVHFVTDEFDKEWVKTEEGKLVTDWSSIRQRIGAFSEKTKYGIKVYDVSSLKKFGIILQGSYNGNDSQMREMSRRFNLFNGTDGRLSGYAKIIQSLWQNSRLLQDEFKRTLIDRLEAGNDWRLTVEPLEEISSAREVALGFASGWSDYSSYLSGDLTACMNLVCRTYERFCLINRELYGFPSLIGSAVSLKKERMDVLAGEIEALSKGELERAWKSKEEFKSDIEDRRNKRRDEIAVLKSKIDEAKENYGKYSEERWAVYRKDIADFQNRSALRNEAESLKVRVEALESRSEAATGNMKLELSVLSERYSQFETQKEKEKNDLLQKREGDARIAVWEGKKILAERYVQDVVLKDEIERLKQRKKENERREEALELNGKVIDKFEDKDEFMGQFMESDDGRDFLSRSAKMAAGFLDGVLDVLFLPIVRFVCKVIFGISCFSRKELEEERRVFEESCKALSADDKALRERKNAEVRKVIASYDAEIEKIKRPYTDRMNAIDEEIRQEKGRVDVEKSRLRELIEKAQSEAGVDVKELKALKDLLEEKNERYDYLVKNAATIPVLEGYLEEYARIGVYSEKWRVLREDDTRLTRAETDEFNKLKGEYDALNDVIDGKNKEAQALKVEIDGLERLVRDFCEDCDIDFEWQMRQIEQAAAVRIPEPKGLAEYFKEWKETRNSNVTCLLTLKEKVNALKRLVSEKDYFGFTLKPEDFLETDADYIRVAEVVMKRNDVTSEYSIGPYLNAWRETANQYLRTIYKIGERATKHTNVDRLLANVASFINRYNESDAIERVRFEVEDGSRNELVKIGMELCKFVDEHEIDLNVVDIAEGVNESLMLFENASVSVRRTLGQFMLRFSEQLLKYTEDNIPPEDFFTVYTYIKEAGKPAERQQYDLAGVGSTGTTITSKTIVAMGLVGEMAGREPVGRNGNTLVHVFLDETGRVDKYNKRLIYNICEKFNLRIFMIEPGGMPDVGDFDYMYAIDYDVASRTRRAKPVLRKRAVPKSVEDYGKVE